MHTILGRVEEQKKYEEEKENAKKELLNIKVITCGKVGYNK